MPRDPTTGVFTRVDNSFSDPVNGTLILPGDANLLFDDYDGGLNDVPGAFEVGQASAGNVGSPGAMGADFTWSIDASARTDALNEGFIWDAKVYSGVVFAKNFSSSFNSSSGYPPTGFGPNPTLFVYAGNSGSNNEVVAIVGDANATVSATTAFGGNIIARSGSGSGALTNVKLVGLEIDVEPATGDTVNAGSGGLFLNAFTTAIPVGIQLGGVSGGSWTNGIQVGSVANAGLSAVGGSTMQWLIYTLGSTFTGSAAILLANGHKLGFNNSGEATASTIRTDAGSNILWTMPTGGFIAIRDAADTQSLIVFDNAGSITNVGFTGLGTAVSTAAWLKIHGSTTSVAQINLPTGSAPSAPNDGDIWREDNTNTGLKIRVNGVTKTITLS